MTSTAEPTLPELTPGRIRKLMRAQSLSQKDVSHASGVGEADVSRIVARNMTPTEDQARRLREVLEPHDDTGRTPVQKVRVSTDG